MYQHERTAVIARTNVNTLIHGVAEATRMLDQTVVIAVNLLNGGIDTAVVFEDVFLLMVERAATEDVDIVKLRGKWGSPIQLSASAMCDLYFALYGR